MSRLLDSWSLTIPRADTPPDSDPVLLGPESSGDACLAAQSELAPNKRDGETVPFIEIPEGDDDPLAAVTCQGNEKSSLRFERQDNVCLSPADQSTSTIASSNLLSSLDAYRPAVTALWQELRRIHAETLLLISPESEASGVSILLSIARVLSECASPTLLIEVPPASGLADQLARAAAPGWSDWLAGLPLEAVVQNTDLTGLHYLAPGHALAITQRRFWCWDWQARLAELRKNYPLVVWWASAKSSWAFPLALLADALCFLAQEKTDSGHSTGLLQALSACSRRCVGRIIFGP